MILIIYSSFFADDVYNRSSRSAKPDPTLLQGKYHIMVVCSIQYYTIYIIYIVCMYRVVTVRMMTCLFGFIRSLAR